LAEFKQEINRKFKMSKLNNFQFPRKKNDPQPQYGKKASTGDQSKIQNLSNRMDLKHNQSSEIAEEMESDSKVKKMNKYIMTSYKPFEYKDKKFSSKIKTKYFYPKQNQNSMNIKNYDFNVSAEYSEGKLIRKIFNRRLEQPKRLNKYNSRMLEEINDKPLMKTNHTSQFTDMNRNSNENKLKELIKTQNQETLNKLLITS
jgi:hypothetical protein